MDRSSCPFEKSIGNTLRARSCPQCGRSEGEWCDKAAKQQHLRLKPQSTAPRRGAEEYNPADRVEVPIQWEDRPSRSDTIRSTHGADGFQWTEPSRVRPDRQQPTQHDSIMAEAAEFLTALNARETPVPAPRRRPRPSPRVTIDDF